MGASAIQEKSPSGFWDGFILLLGQILQSHPFFIKDTRNGNLVQGLEERTAEFLVLPGWKGM